MSPDFKTFPKYVLGICWQSASMPEYMFSSVHPKIVTNIQSDTHSCLCHLCLTFFFSIVSWIVIFKIGYQKLTVQNVRYQSPPRSHILIYFSIFKGTFRVNVHFISFVKFLSWKFWIYFRGIEEGSYDPLFWFEIRLNTIHQGLGVAQAAVTER